MPRSDLASVGEFGLIARLAAIAGPGNAVVGIGDDTAVLDIPGDRYLLATVDAQVEDVHFRREGVAPIVLGRRALAVNLSDIAAMGGQPTTALVSFVLPPDLPVTYVEDIFCGICGLGERYGVGVAGGNIARSAGELIVDITLLGTVPKDAVLRRSGARPGDVLAVAGFLGDRAAAQRILDSPDLGTEVSLQDFLQVQLEPAPQVELGQRLASSHLVNAMMDISDGLASDVHRLCEASGVGAVLYEGQIPISRAARDVAEAAAINPVDLALFGGEDYVLLLAVSPDRLHEAQAVAGDTPLYEVGTVTDAALGVTIQWKGGAREPLPAGGWQHF